MAIELTNGSIHNLCNGINVQQPIVQLLGYEAVELISFGSNYRLVLSDGVYMNSYFFLCKQLNELIVQKQLKYGTIMRIDEFKLTDGENCTDQSPRWIIFIQRVTILVHRKVFGDPQPLINIKKLKKPLINLNLNSCPSRVFDNIEQLENKLTNIKDLKSLSNGKCDAIFKLTVIRKLPVLTFSSCRVLNMTMEDSTGVINVSAFNSLSDRMNEILKENNTYYIADTIWKQKPSGNELKLQSYSVIIECVSRTVKKVQSMNTQNFNTLLANNPNTFCNLIGVCIEVSDIEVCSNSTARTEIAKRELLLIDSSMATITLKVWGENVNKFDEKFDDPPIVTVKQAVLKQFDGAKHFSMVKFSVLSVNPNTAEARELKEWYRDMLTMEDF